MVKQQFTYTCDYCGNIGLGNSAILEWGSSPYEPELPADWRWFDDGKSTITVMCPNHQVTVK
jgi:hypothetical protein